MVDPHHIKSLSRVFAVASILILIGQSGSWSGRLPTAVLTGQHWSLHSQIPAFSDVKDGASRLPFTKLAASMGDRPDLASMASARYLQHTPALRLGKSSNFPLQALEGGHCWATGRQASSRRPASVRARSRPMMSWRSAKVRARLPRSGPWHLGSRVHGATSPTGGRGARNPRRSNLAGRSPRPSRRLAISWKNRGTNCTTAFQSRKASSRRIVGICGARSSSGARHAGEALQSGRCLWLASRRTRRCRRGVESVVWTKACPDGASRPVWHLRPRVSPRCACAIVPAPMSADRRVASCCSGAWAGALPLDLAGSIGVT